MPGPNGPPTGGIFELSPDEIALAWRLVIAAQPAGAAELLEPGALRARFAAAALGVASVHRALVAGMETAWGQETVTLRSRAGRLVGEDAPGL